MVKKLQSRTRTRTTGTRPKRKPEIDEEEERIYAASIRYLMTKHGHLLVPSGLRKVQIKGFDVWILSVVLRYPTGHEGYVGDLLYDGEEFTFLTEQAIMDERVKQIANDPERLRAWNEYRASTLRTGKR
jgi:hypothetical protein